MLKMEDCNQAEDVSLVIQIEDVVFGNIGENNDQILSDRGGKPVEESLAPGNFIVAQQSNKTNIGNSAGSKVSKNKDAIWRKQGTNICSSLENESSNVAKGDWQGNTFSQSKMCSSSNPAARNAEEMGICQLPFENNSSVDSKVTFLANENDLLYYDWSGISSFDDVDKMFRNCDPTFGQWSNTDGPSWISSSDDMFGPEDKLTSAFESSTLEFKELENASAYCENSRCLHECNTPQVDTHSQSCLTCPSFKSSAVQAYDGGGEEENKSSTTPFSTNYLGEHEPQIDIQTQQLNRQFLSDVKGKALATYPAQFHSKRDCFAKSDSSSFTQSLNPDFHVDNKLPYQDLLLQSASSTVTGCKQDPSSLFEVSAHVSNNSSHGMGKVPDALLNNPVMKLEVMVDRPNIRSLELGNSVRKQYTNFGQNIHNDRGNTSIELHEKDMDSAVEKNPLMPSVFLGDLSVKVISFQQLHGVIGQVCVLQLEYRTKRCIRDSLYRLARSAEQRHNFAAANAEGVDYGRGIHGTGTSHRSVEYMDKETETNPIDRSVAHLLFHRTPETATRSVDDATSFASHECTTYIC